MTTELQPVAQTKLSDDEWSIECGAAGCVTVLAGVAWVDIDYNMAENAADATGSPVLLSQLRADYLRRYRMCVMLPFDWQFDRISQVWRTDAPHSSQGFPRVRAERRIVRGPWNNELGQMGVPPIVLVCFACGTRQAVTPVRRKGTPDIALLKHSH